MGTAKMIFRTPCQQEREARDMEIYTEYKKLMGVEGQSKTSVKDYLMKKYGIHSQGTIYVILRRVEARLKQELEREEVAL